jgi:hypothetical protein
MGGTHHRPCELNEMLQYLSAHCEAWGYAWITTLDIRGYWRCIWGGIKPRGRVTWLFFTRLTLLCTGFVLRTTFYLVRERLAAARNRRQTLTENRCATRPVERSRCSSAGDADWMMGEFSTELLGETRFYVGNMQSVIF